jgi:hypothetical protein
MRCLLAVVVLSVCAFANADDLRDRLADEVARSMKQSMMEQQELSAKIKELRSGRVNKRQDKAHVSQKIGSRVIHIWNSDEAKTKAIKEAEQDLAKVSDPKSHFPKLRFEVGSVGIFPSNEIARKNGLVLPGSAVYDYVVSQVIDDTNMLVRPRKTDLGTVSPKIDTNNGTIFWLIANTQGIANDTKIKLDDVYHVTGTKQYKTAIGGSNTVFVVEMFDAGGVIEKAKSLLK